MTEKEEKIKLLLESWLDHSISDQQKETFLAIYRKEPLLVESLIDSRITDFEGLTELSPETKTDILQAIFSSGKQQAPPVGRMHFSHRLRWAAAALFLLIAGASGWLLLREQKKSIKIFVAKDVKAPAVNRAMIRLSNGRTVYLDSSASGQLAQQDDVKLVKLADGRIVYDGKATAVSYNTLTNPTGSNVVHITLTDSSEIWLNAGSSVTYPIVFVGNERKVSISGEAYFEVKHNEKMPFKVMLPDGSVVEDMGTKFNVNAYADEAAIKTTLLEGAVKIKDIVLEPGQAYGNGKVEVVDAENSIAWIKGKFKFNGADLQAVMRQIARWYDVEIVYTDKIPDYRFSGGTYRNINLSEVLKVLELNRDIHFAIEGKKLIVNPVKKQSYK